MTTEEIDRDAIEVQHTRDRLRFIELKRRALSRASRLFDEAKAAADAAKKALEVAQLEYNAAGEQEDPPLLEVCDTNPDGWKSAPIQELGKYGVSDSTIEDVLRIGVGITTLGGFWEFLEAHQQGVRAIKGVGEKKAEAIENAWEAYFNDHPEYCQQRDDDTADEGETDGD